MLLRAQMSRSLWQTIQVAINSSYNNDNENKIVSDSKKSFFDNNRSAALLVTVAFHYIEIAFPRGHRVLIPCDINLKK